MEETNKENLIVNLTLEFAIDIVKYCDVLEDSRKYVIARQLLKSGTSIGANVREETEYWLLICKNSTGYPEITLLMEKLKSIQRIINKIIVTSKV